MASTSGPESYYCHMCRVEITPNLQNFTCPSCNSGFIEAVTPGNDALAELPEQYVNALQLIDQMFGTPLREPFLQLLRAENEDSDEMFSEQDDDTQLTEDVRGTRRSRRVSSRPSRTTGAYSLRSNNRSPISRVTVGGRSRTFQLPQLSAMSVTSGSIPIIPWPTMFDSFVTVLLNELQVGPPPASESAIADLPVSVLTEEEALKLDMCSICFDNFKANDSVTQLPCSHFYHQNCVTRWLQEHGTCPVCRKDLAGHDTSRLEDNTGVNPMDSSGPSQS